MQAQKNRLRHTAIEPSYLIAVVLKQKTTQYKR
jgi:hypothetical protein